MKERTLDQQKKESSYSINAELYAEKRRRGGKNDVVICAELFDAVNHEFLNQVCAVGNAGDESCAGNRNATERQPRADGANKKRGHSNSDQWELPDASRDGEGVGFAQI